MYFNDENSALKDFVRARFLPQLDQMGCKYVTHQDFPCGKTLSDGVDNLVKQCSLFLLFSPSEKAKILLDTLTCRVLTNPHRRSLIVPIRLSIKENCPTIYDHLTGLTLDITEPDSEVNIQAFRQIREIVEEGKCERQLRDVDASTFDKQRCNFRNIKRKKSQKRIKKKVRGHRREDDMGEQLESTSVELMETACSISMSLIRRRIIALFGVLLIIDFCREILFNWTSVMKADNSASPNNVTNVQPSRVPVGTIWFVFVVCKMISGFASIYCHRSFTPSIQEEGLRAVMQRTDIQSIREYLVKESLLVSSTRDVETTEVLGRLRAYLQSTEWVFCICPWIHCGLLVALSLIGPFRDDQWHRQPESTNFQLVCQAVDVLTTLLVLGFCHSGASLYHIQNKFLVDIVRVFTYSKNQNSPSEGIISACKKLRCLIDDSMTTVFRLSISVILLQFIVLLWLTIPDKSNMEEEVISAQRLVNLYLLISEGMSNCPSRFMKSLGLALDFFMIFGICIVMNYFGYYKIVTFPYGSVRLMAFRLLSYKMCFILCLHSRLIKVAGDWPNQAEPQQPVCNFTTLELVIVLWIFGFVVDCFLVFY